MQITSPRIRSLPLLAALCTVTLGAQAPQRFQSQPRERRSQPADQPSLPTTTERLTGVVVSSVDGSTVPRTLVTSTDQRFAAFTDSQGRFAFDLRRTVSTGSTPAFSSYPPGPTPGPSSISLAFSVRKPGYVSNVLSFELPALQPGVPEPPLTLKIVPTGVIAGHIYPESGDLPESLLIQLLHKQVNNGSATWFPANATNVNRHGEFRFANLQPGDYKLVIPAQISNGDSSAAHPTSIYGSLPTYYPNAAREDSAAILPVAAGAFVAADLNLHIAPFYDVVIPLASVPGQGYLRAMLLNAAPGLFVQQNGQSFATHLPDGTYDLLISSTEQSSPTDPVPLVSSALVKIDVSGKAVRALPVALHPTPLVPVIVRRQFTSGEPQPPNQPSVFVLLQSVRIDQPSPSLKGNTGDEGLGLVGAMPGTFTVNITARSGGSAYIASAASGTTDLLREPFQVLPNSDPRPIEITLRDDSASIEATLTVDPATPPLSLSQPALLLCIPLDRPQAMPGYFVAQKNLAVASNLAPGRYLLLAMHDATHIQTLEYRDPDVLRSLMQKGVVVTLSPNEKATVQVPFMPDGDN